MGEWKETRFSEIATVIMGQSPASEFYNSDGKGLPFMQGNSTFGDRYPTIDTYTTQITKKAPQNSILMSVRAPVGDINIAPLEMCIGRGLCAINAKDGNNEFVRYLLSYNMPKLKSSENGTTFTAINGDNIKNLKILVPDPPTQKWIADILSAYDDLIENNNRRIALLEKAAQDLYKEWFVRFRFPGHETAKFENGLPSGWDVVKLGDYVDIKGGKRLPEGKSLCSEVTEHPYIRIRDITLSKHVSLTDSFEYIDNDTFNIIHRFTVNTNDILISIVGTIGAVACVAQSLNGANLTENCVKLVNLRHFTNSYLYHFLNSEAGKGSIQAGVVGATQPKLPLYNIKRIKLLKPSADIISTFTTAIEPIDQEIMALTDKNRNLARQRDLLLPRLMSGKLEVKNV